MLTIGAGRDIPGAMKASHIVVKLFNNNVHEGCWFLTSLSDMLIK